ncbi:MAG TPA: hypothetical protein VGC97_07375 [Pyrinomonadaceae bacterium]|jgi:hypothetical protein
MQKILFAAVFSIALFLSFTLLKPVAGQNENPAENSPSKEDGYTCAGGLRSDLKVSDAVLYVNVLSRRLEDQIGDGGCEQDTGGGYCLYLLKAEVKEVFKGKIKKGDFEFYTTTDADYRSKDWLLGEHIVFLVESDNYTDKKPHFGTIENSTRSAAALETMRKIVDPEALIDETDEDEPYSREGVKKDFDESSAVVYADVTSFKPATDDISIDAFVLKAKVIEVFKGTLKAGQEIEFKSDLLYRPARAEDLGRQIIYLERKESEGGVKYERINSTISDVRHNILEKLRKAASEKSKEKK